MMGGVYGWWMDVGGGWVVDHGGWWWTVNDWMLLVALPELTTRQTLRPWNPDSLGSSCTTLPDSTGVANQQLGDGRGCHHCG